MRRLYETPLSADDYQASGIPAAAIKSFQTEPDEIEIWPCNKKTFLLFAAMRTQWVFGPAGKAALNYAVLDYVGKKIGVTVTPERFAAIQSMELEALKAMSAKQG